MAAIPLKITDNGNGILVKGTNNVFFPDNATLTFPYNSIILIVDESDMVTFRSAANNDVLFSGQIGKIDIGEEIVTKANIIEKFDAVANQATGGGDIDYSGLFAGVSYDSQTKHINFYDKDDALVTYVDATAFIKDGMVDTVVISNGNLVITFNTDAGKQPISIPLTDIFNPDNYYDKTTSDGKYATQTVVNQEIAARIQGDSDLNTALQAKADKTDTYTKTQVDTALAAKADSSSLATVATSGDYDDLTNKPTIPAAQVNADWNASSGVAQILNKPTNVSAFTNDAGYLTQHQSLADYYTKSEVDSELADKQDTLTAGTGIDITNNVISATGGTQVQSDWNQSDSSAVDYIKNKPTIPDTSDFVSKSEYNPKEVAIAQALTDLNENKADKTELPDTSTFATKTELNGKQDTLVSGTNIKTINNQSLLGSGDITIQGGGMTMQEYYEDVDTNMYRDYTYIETEIGVYPNNFMLVPFDYETGTIVTGGQVIEEYGNETIVRLIEEVDDGNYTIEVDGGQYIPMSDITVDGSQLLIEFDWEDSEQQTQTASVQVVSNQVVVTKFPDDCYLRFFSNNNTVGWTELEDNYYNKTEIDAMIGNINTILASI